MAIAERSRAAAWALPEVLLPLPMQWQQQLLLGLAWLLLLHRTPHLPPAPAVCRNESPSSTWCPLLSHMALGLKPDSFPSDCLPIDFGMHLAFSVRQSPKVWPALLMQPLRPQFPTA